MRRVNIFSVVMMCFALLIVSTGSGIGQIQYDSKISDELLIQYKNTEKVDLIVEINDQVDLTFAYSQNDWIVRGKSVYQALQSHALKSQAEVVQYSKENGLEIIAYLTSNSVYVKQAKLIDAEQLARFSTVKIIRKVRQIQVISDSSFMMQEQFYPTMTPNTIEWGVQDIKADQVWSDFGVRGDGVKIGLLDTGVEWDHPALINQFACPGDPTNPACWYDPGNKCGSSGACDNVGHGTHLMGSMVGDDGNGNQIGVAPEASWIACKACDYSCMETSLNACADWILAPGGDPNNRPQIVGNGWGGSGGNDWFRSQVQAWRAAGIFPVFPLGGSGPSCASLGSPSDYQESFSSGAYDINRLIAPFSPRGPSSFGHDPYTKPNISTPGMNIRSSFPGGGYQVYSGTSMSGAFATGAAALLLSACPELQLDIEGTFQNLQNNVDLPPAGSCGIPPDGHGNYTYGYGYLNIYNSIQNCILEKMFVSDITLRGIKQGSRYVVGAFLTIMDPTGLGVPSAQVTVDITDPGNQVRTINGFTRNTGKITFIGRSKEPGTWQVCVTNIIKDGFSYDPGQNYETCAEIIIP